jgi:HD-GYP domain-containing protein (c-di-GMP phosphodiesterase class II)
VIITLANSCEREGEVGETPMPAPFKQIPGVTQEEIKAIEELAEQGASFVYGTLPSTESFYGKDGEIRGFTALFCDWLAELFGMPFVPKFYEWGEIIDGLETGEIDFTGELTATDERRKTYIMTDAIAGRSVKYMRIAGSAPLAYIAESRPLRYGFLLGTTTFEDVSEQYENKFESFFVNTYAEAYNMLESGKIDAFIEENPAEAVFDAYGNVVAKDLFPLIYGTVSLTTKKPENAPIISVVQKALRSGSLRHLTELYSSGMYEYKKHKLLMSLTEEEKAYMQKNPVVKFVAEHDNYPISFYNTHDKEFQGICHDALKEIEKLTGFNFKRINNHYADWAVLFKMLEDGEASMVSELIATPKRKGNFLWPQTTIFTDYHALISKSELPNIDISEILYMKIGLVKDYAQTEIFNHWFPDHRYAVVYDNFNQAFEALERDEIDMVMGSEAQLYVQSNYREMPGYKANIVFNYPYSSTFGFNKNEKILRSIVDKALRLIDTKSISDHWMRKIFDYRKKMALSRLPWLIGAIALLLLVIALVLIMFYRNRKAGMRRVALQNTIMETMAELVEYRDHETGDHIERTSKYLKILIDELLAQGLYKDQTLSWNIKQMISSAQLHDVGKIAIEDSILNKPGKLTEEEFEKMKKHTIFGGEIIERIQMKSNEKEFLDYAKIFTLYHHEKWNGKGYPYGIKGETIPLAARLMAIIDVYDALISKRPYKEPFTHEEAIKIITEGRGTQFDPVLTDLFLSIAERFRVSG